MEIAGDESTGLFKPADVRLCNWPRVDSRVLTRLATLRGLTPTASDVLDELCIPLVTGADILVPRRAGARIAGQAVTVRYLPERRTVGAAAEAEASRLAHRSVLSLCRPGDVLVIDAGGQRVSAFGGMAALDTMRAGLAGVIVDGAIRDLDEIEESGLPVWSRWVTPLTGKFRLEAVQINAPVCCGGQHVVGGDLVLADASGVCFVPIEAAGRAAEAILQTALPEMRRLDESLTTTTRI